MLCLTAFALLLTRAESVFAGRLYAAYEDIYVATSVLWLWLIEGAQPSGSDSADAGLCLLGTYVILLQGRLLDRG
jgi:small multidrug resistance family-3 protein